MREQYSMPNNITENTRRFIENAEVDYFTYFIKAWIPFNGWYKNKWHDLQSDRQAINTIKDTVNEAKSALIRYLENDSDEAKTFRSYLSSLHFQLLDNRIDNNGNRISFEAVKVGRNRNKVIDENYNRLRYQIERTDNRSGVEQVVINVTRTNGSPVCGEIIQDDYDVDVLRDNREFQKLTLAQKNKLVGFYTELVPYQSLNLLEQHPRDDPINYTQIGSFKFTESKEKIAQGLVEVMYSLRCVLFHGELNPNEANNEVYKNLYHVLFMILQKLR